jgi:predicted glycogen debranching enzyme
MPNDPSPFITFGREDAGTLAFSEKREWLVTNGIGGYSSGTVSGVLTRRYHGLLIAPLEERTLLAAKMDEIAQYGGKHFPLAANRWQDMSISPHGYTHIDTFYLHGAIPTWNFAFSDAVLEKKIWMEQGDNTTYVKYTLLRASLPLQLTIKPLVNYRGYHNLTQAGNWQMDISKCSGGLKIQAFDHAVPFYIMSNEGTATVAPSWYRNYYLSEEKARGLGCLEDHLCAGALQTLLKEGDSLTLVSSLDPTASLDGETALARRIKYEETLVHPFQSSPKWVKQLILASDQFLIDRPLKNHAHGKTIIAGYHWFTDWGRDTMISLPGLTVATGRLTAAREILQTFSLYVDQGMLPNRFPDGQQAPEYNTVDAALWYFEALNAYIKASGDIELLTELFPVLETILQCYSNGTRHGIHQDPQDGLLFAGEPGVQLTWMDAKVGDWVITPRIGKPVEVNALWYNALRLMAQFANKLQKPTSCYDSSADLVRQNFTRFWNAENGYCFDVIDGPEGDDDSLRPNQIFAVSLPFSPLSKENQKGVVDTLAKELFTSHGLRSLAQSHPSYRGHYGGDQLQRDSAYHQGTVWMWLLGPYSLAHLKVYENPVAALDLLSQAPHHLRAAGLGSCSEIFDGDAPMNPKGCIAQAWSVAQLLQARETILRGINHDHPL